MLELNLYKNNDANSQNYGKAYCRVDQKETYTIEKLAEHMAEHNTPFSKGTIDGILTDAVNCIRELCLNGNTVKIDNLAIFMCSVESNPMSRYGIARASVGNKSTKVNGQTIETGNAVKSVKLLAKSTGNFTRAELNKDVRLGWTKKAKELIEDDKAVMSAGNNG